MIFRSETLGYVHLLLSQQNPPLYKSYISKDLEQGNGFLVVNTHAVILQRTAENPSRPTG